MASERCPKCKTCGAKMFLNGMFYSCENPFHPNVDAFDEAKETRIKELESLLRASEARERELQGKLDATENECMEALNNFSNAVSESSKIEGELLAFKTRERKLQGKLDAALDQVVVLREAALEAHEHVGSEGYSEGSEAKVLVAIEDTSATAQQRVEAIRREAVEEFMKRVADRTTELKTQGVVIDDILGEKEG